MVSAIKRNSSALGASFGWASAAARRTSIDLDVGNGNGPRSVAVGKWTEGSQRGLLVMAWLGCIGSKLFDRNHPPQFELIRGTLFPNRNIG
jgi:hypothetical protein